MSGILKWVADNKDWIFDGVGVALIVGIVTWFGSRRDKGSADNIPLRQRQRGGKGSTNVQIGSIHKEK